MNFDDPKNHYDVPFDDDGKLPTNRLCTCGHTLLMHAFTHYIPFGIRTGKCIYSDECGCTGFKWTGEVE